MTRQGYLILHEKRARPKIYYFSIEDGFFRYYASAQCTKCVGEVKLSGCKLTVKAQKRLDAVPHSFYLETRKVFVKDRSYTLGNAVRVELSACSNDDRQEWGKALFSWQRYYWRDPQTAAPGECDDATDAAATTTSDATTKAQLEDLIDRFFAKETSSYATSFASSAKQPLSFIRRNAHSIRRSMSFSMLGSAAAASTPSTASSSTSSTSSHAAVTKNNVKSNSKSVLAKTNGDDNNNKDNNQSHDKADATSVGEPTDCATDKVVLAKMSSHHHKYAPIGTKARSAFSHEARGTNQELH